MKNIGQLFEPALVFPNFNVSFGLFACFGIAFNKCTAGWTCNAVEITI